MELKIGHCYAVLLADGSVETIRFSGQDSDGVVRAESPPGSGSYIKLLDLFNDGWKAHWEILCE
jgi:hypothetical protein